MRTSWRRQVRAAMRAVLASVVLLCATAPAALAASPELKCQDSIAGAASKYFKDRYKAISKCEDSKAAGKLAQDIDCRPDPNTPVTDPKTEQKLDKAATKLGKKIGKKCSDAQVAGLTFDLPCETVGTVSQLVDCIINEAHGANADQLIESVYATTGRLGDKGVRLCQKTISKESLKYVKARMAARGSCAKKLMGGELDACPDDKTRAEFEKALTKFRDKVLKKCTNDQVVHESIDFGYPCELFDLTAFEREPNTNNNAMPKSERLARCMAAAAAIDADTGAFTAYPLPDPAPFSFGVAAGDATPTSFIAWTRADDSGTVTLEVATDPDFTAPDFTASSLVPDPNADNTVKVDVVGLLAASTATQYYYRFIQGPSTSRTGRVRTAPDPNSSETVSLAWTGDAYAFFRPYTVLEGIVEDDPDLFLYIGDTVIGDEPTPGSGIATTRSEYHAKYRENWSDRSLRDVLASIGTVSIWDDHEVTNDFWGTDPNIQTQMTEGSLAFRDYMPMREDTGDPMRLYRSFQWGKAAEIFLIDDRQYRSSQAYITEPACLDPNGAPETLPAHPDCVAEIADPNRVYLGAAQKQWLKDGLLNSTATFKFIMNGPPITSLMFVPFDRWEGYSAERQEILDYIATNNIRNVIFLSTDLHALIINEELAASPTVRELIAGPVGRDSIFREFPPDVAAVLPVMPSIFPTITYFDIDRFNYGLIEVTPTQATFSARDNTGTVLWTLPIPKE